LIDHVKDGDKVEVYLTNDAAEAFTDGTIHFTALNGYGLPGGGKKYEGDYIKEDLNVQLYSTGAATPIEVIYTDTIDYGF
jgi:hypothetical protein